MPSLLHYFLYAFACLNAVSAKHYTIELAPKEINPDGFPRTAALVDGQFPGPVLCAWKGEHLEVNVVNKLDDPTMRRSTSIHWHGIFQPHRAQDDGASFITQCPIGPGRHYRYTVKTGGQSGTYWYHSHLGTQYIDGIRGPLVIYDPYDPLGYLYDVDNEDTIITFADWYHGKAEALLAALRGGAFEPIPDSGLINGIGRFQGGPNVTLARINVDAGLRYRFRLIGLSGDGFFDFAIQNHHMKVIELDGIEHHPVDADSVLIGPGQRFSVVVHADQPVGNYWIRATQSVIAGKTSFPTNPNFNGNSTHAVFHYSGADDAEPPGPPINELPPGGVPYVEAKSKPLINPGSPGGENPPDLKVFNFSFALGAPNGAVWTVNDVAYKPPSVPTLLNVLANGPSAKFGADENTISIPRGITVEITFTGATVPFPVGAGHPFHLHGHAFDVIQSNTGPVNFVDPPRRDTVQSGFDPSVRVRFRTDNPGPWFVHCHIEWHLNSGLAVVFVEDSPDIAHDIRPNEQWKELCKIYNNLPPDQQ